MSSNHGARSLLAIAALGLASCAGPPREAPGGPVSEVAADPLSRRAPAPTGETPDGPRSETTEAPMPGGHLGPMRVFETAEGVHGRIEVLEHKGSLALAIDGVFQTLVPASPLGVVKGMLLRGGDHVELVPYFRPAARSALLIGLGGGLQEKALSLYGIEMTAVDIDPEVVRLAAQRFGVGCETIVADGRAFLERDPRRFDAIVLDVFAGASFPAHLFTREAFEAAARRLAQDGILAVHLIGRPAHPAIEAVARTLEAVFPHVTTTRSGTAGRLEAIYLFASASPIGLGPWVRAEVERLGLASGAFASIPTEGASVLSDARNDLSTLARDIGEEHRRMSLEIRRSPPW